jgi:hypothetical protein
MIKENINLKHTLMSTFVNISIGFFELFLFVSALLLVSKFLSIISILALLFLYLWAYQSNIIEKETVSNYEIVTKYFSFPIILLILMLLTHDLSLKLAIISFASQGAMKALIKVQH